MNKLYHFPHLTNGMHQTSELGHQPNISSHIYHELKNGGTKYRNNSTEIQRNVTQLTREVYSLQKPKNRNSGKIVDFNKRINFCGNNQPDTYHHHNKNDKNFNRNSFDIDSGRRYGANVNSRVTYDASRWQTLHLNVYLSLEKTPKMRSVEQGDPVDEARHEPIGIVEQRDDVDNFCVEATKGNKMIYYREKLSMLRQQQKIGMSCTVDQPSKSIGCQQLVESPPLLVVAKETTTGSSHLAEQQLNEQQTLQSRSINHHETACHEISDEIKTKVDASVLAGSNEIIGLDMSRSTESPPVDDNNGCLSNKERPLKKKPFKNCSNLCCRAILNNVDRIIGNHADRINNRVLDDMKPEANRGTKRHLELHASQLHQGTPDIKKAKSCLNSSSCCNHQPHIDHQPLSGKLSPLNDRSSLSATESHPSSSRLPDLSRSNDYKMLSDAIWTFYKKHQQRKDIYIGKMKLRDALYSVMKSVFPYCGLYVIGSSMNGFAGMNSDMDLCLMLSHSEIDQRREATDILRILHGTLSQCSFLHCLKLIQAKVPILKFTDRISGVECDLNINNSVGIRNTHLLNAYSSMDWRIPPLVIFIKQWAKLNGINEASRGTISSYSLVLMVLHYLQCGCNPPVLPSLQQKYPHKFNDSTDIRSLSLNEKLAPYSSPNNQTLGELFAGFIDYFACKFQFEEEVMSVRLGRRIPHDEQHCPGQWKYIGIQEPFNLTNTAYSVFDSSAFHRIIKVFRVCRCLFTSVSTIDLENLFHLFPEVEAHVDGESSLLRLL